MPEPLHRTTAGRGAAEGLRRDARPRLGIGHRRRRCQRGRSRGARRTCDSADESIALIEIPPRRLRDGTPSGGTWVDVVSWLISPRSVGQRSGRCEHRRRPIRVDHVDLRCDQDLSRLTPGGRPATDQEPPFAHAGMQLAGVPLPWDVGAIGAAGLDRRQRRPRVVGEPQQKHAWQLGPDGLGSPDLVRIEGVDRQPIARRRRPRKLGHLSADARGLDLQSCPEQGPRLDPVQERSELRDPLAAKAIAEPGSGIELAQAREGHRRNGSMAIGRPVDRGIVVEDQLAVGGPADVRLGVDGALPSSLLEGGPGVLGARRPTRPDGRRRGARCP